MLNYRPLDESRSEIRLLSIPRPQPLLQEGCPLQCGLLQVSLDDLDDQYVKFLDLSSQATIHPQTARDVCELLWKWLRLPSQQQEDELWYGRSTDPLMRYVYEKAAGIMHDNEYLNEMTSSLHRSRKDRYQWGDFYALSYQWGDPNRTATILVDGVAVRVTKNLQEALVGICSLEWETTDHENTLSLWEATDYQDTIYVWADAICINQQDIPERNAQVRLMNEIYTRALRVLTWTGPGSELEPALELVRRVRDIRIRDGEGVEYWNSLRSLFTKAHLPGWVALHEIGSRSYWSRLWIIQEQLLASESSIIYFGAEYCLVRDFFDAIYELERNHDAIRELANDGDESAPLRELHMRRLLEFCKLRRSYNHMTVNTWPSRLLLCGAMAQQKDERDKIYGLLSLMDRKAQGVEVDYSKPYPVVYRDFVRHMVEETGRLNVIYYLGANYSRNSKVSDEGSTKPHLPSWVPDWSSVEMANGDFESNLVTSHLEYSLAHSGTSHVGQRETDLNRLTCKGFLFDTIDGLACSHYVSELHHDHDVVAPVSSSGDCPVVGDMKAMKEAMWQCLIMDSPSFANINREFIDGYPYFPDVLGDDDNAAQYFPGLSSDVASGMNTRAMPMVEWQRCNRHLRLFGLPLPAFFNQRFADADRVYFKQISSHKMEIDNTMARVVQWRRMITTTRSYIGMAPKASRQGDNIFLLKGCNVPLVLRPNGDGTYYLVGECYVAGVMEGQAMRKFLTDGSTEEMNVVLR